MNSSPHELPVDQRDAKPVCAFLTRRELAAQLKCSVAAIRVWQRQGLPVLRLGRLCRYRLADVLEWFAARDKKECK